MLNFRRLLLATVAGCTLAAPHARAQVSAADIAGWGDAWGEEIAPQPVPPRTAAAVPAPAVAPSIPTAPAAVRPGPAASDIKGWGDAWGDEGSAPQQPAPATSPQRRSEPVVAAPQAPAPVAAAPATVRGPTPSDLGGWGSAWNADAAEAAPAATPTPVRVAASSNQDMAPPASIRPTAPTTPPPSLPAARSPADMPARQGGMPSENAPVQLTADQIIHDRDLGVVTARGRVEIVQAGRTLVADSVSYNLKQDVVNASGNVTVLEPTGEVMFANYFELTGDFKEGVAKEIRVIMVDRSRMAAATARRVGGNRTDFDKGVYTACEPCAKNPDKRPLWEAKAQRITHDETDKTIEYRDAWLELAGVPIAYTPYLSHPDPTVKRKSGFLTPSAGVSSQLGVNFSTPYFFAIDDNQDFTFSPRFLFPKSTATEAPTVSSDDNSVLQRVVLAGDHRWIGRFGETRSVGSLTANKETGDLRGHVDANGRFDINENWRAGYKVQRVSDDSYLPVYGYTIPGNRPWLTTRPYVENFGRKNYGVVEGFSFQGLRATDDPGRSPLVLPHASYSFIGDPSPHGSYWTFDSDALAYTQSEGTDSGRLSSQVGWHRQFISPLGDFYRLSTTMRADGYHSNDLTNGSDSSATAGRMVPQVAVNWRFPFANPGGALPQVIEPLAMVAASPNGGNPRNIPNEDSIDFELDEINVLRPNRLPGLDRVEGGLRGGYGLRWSAYPPAGGYFTAQVAQGWRAHADSTFAQDSGFKDEQSDYLGRLDFSPPSNNFALLNRVRLDKDTLDVRRNENTLTLGPPMLRLSTTYLMVDQNVDQVDFQRRQYLAYSVSSRLTQYWTLLGTASHDLTDGGGLLGWQARAIYSDDCFAFVTNLRRYYTTNTELGTGYELTFNIVFKTLGDVPFNVF